MARINGLPSSSRGAVAELIAGADLMLKGFEVYRNLAPCGTTDLIAAKGNQFWRVQVKSGNNSVDSSRDSIQDGGDGAAEGTGASESEGDEGESSAPRNGGVL